MPISDAVVVYRPALETASPYLTIATFCTHSNATGKMFSLKFSTIGGQRSWQSITCVDISMLTLSR